MTQRPELLEALVELARRAGREVMEVYGADFAVQRKADASPVTDADLRAEGVIVAGLSELTPEIPVVAEEAVAAGHVPQVGDRFWLVDALDGTREFVQRNGEFTVNIALVEHGEPVLGVVFAPALERLYAGRVGAGAFVETQGQRRPLRCRVTPDSGAVVAASRSHGDAATLQAWLAAHHVARVLHAGSSLKFGLLAAGEADLYPRLSRTMEWDIAAGQALLVAAGGSVCTLEGAPLRYGKPGFENPHFVARGAGKPRNGAPTADS